MQRCELESDSSQDFNEFKLGMTSNSTRTLPLWLLLTSCVLGLNKFPKLNSHSMNVARILDLLLLRGAHRQIMPVCFCHLLRGTSKCYNGSGTAKEET